MLELLALPASEYCCEEMKLLLLLEVRVEDVVVDLLGGLSNRIEGLESGEAICAEEETDVSNQEVTDLQLLPCLLVVAVLRQFLCLFLERLDERKEAIGPLIAQVVLKR